MTVEVIIELPELNDIDKALFLFNHQMEHDAIIGDADNDIILSDFEYLVKNSNIYYVSNYPRFEYDSNHYQTSSLENILLVDIPISINSHCKVNEAFVLYTFRRNYGNLMGSLPFPSVQRYIIRGAYIPDGGLSKRRDERINKILI
jgi:hypothetical protein